MRAMKMVHLSLFAFTLAFIAGSLAGCGKDDKKEAEGSAATTTTTTTTNANPCHGKKPLHANVTAADKYFANEACGNTTLDQAGTNVTKGYKGTIDASTRTPILKAYKDTDLCPVNVHWHLGAEHLSVGEYDEKGTGPARRLAASSARRGFRCRHYNKADPKFTTPYAWKHCVGMKVGETYEVHWPHSAAGHCGTKWQYQTPFYDGVFCKGGIISLKPLNTYQKIGVQSQVYTVVNDENYYYKDMFKGMRTDGDFGKEMTYYTGSTTGTSRDNTICSRYTPITWQVDRTCHLISASSFDKMCEEMKKQADSMYDDLHAHGARELVADKWAANNHQNRLLSSDESRHLASASASAASKDDLQVAQDNIAYTLKRLSYGYGSANVPAPATKKNMEDWFALQDAYATYSTAILGTDKAHAFTASGTVLAEIEKTMARYKEEIAAADPAVPVARLDAASRLKMLSNQMVTQALAIAAGKGSTLNELDATISEFSQYHAAMKNGGFGMQAIIKQRSDLEAQWRVVDGIWLTFLPLMKELAAGSSLTFADTQKKVEKKIAELDAALTTSVDLNAKADPIVPPKEEGPPWTLIVYGSSAFAMVVFIITAIVVIARRYAARSSTANKESVAV
eukprot:TRINITY_DN2336_c0_g1_i11.p1 TRINITY_DN2336_c0_g1~~TRINITY_DN2336_c0_g1_i11.p1  ORF type:complete len:624 (-),score=132.51 TRINITY_DN2336_c0_g1_i11:108-1979(-)